MDGETREYFDAMLRELRALRMLLRETVGAVDTPTANAVEDAELASQAILDRPHRVASLHLLKGGSNLRARTPVPRVPRPPVRPRFSIS